MTMSLLTIIFFIKLSSNWDLH